MANLHSKSTKERGKKMSDAFKKQGSGEEPKPEVNTYYEADATPVPSPAPKSMLRKLLDKGKELLDSPEYGEAKYNTLKGAKASKAMKETK